MRGFIEFKDSRNFQVGTLTYGLYTASLELCKGYVRLNYMGKLPI